MVETSTDACSGKMTSQNIAAKVWLLSLLTIGSFLHPARCGTTTSRHNDSAEFQRTLMTSTQWRQQSVSEEGTGDRLNPNPPVATNNTTNHRAKVTEKPEDDFYDIYNPPEEAPPLEEDMLNLERNRESGYTADNDKLPFQEPSDVDFLTKSKDFLNPEFEKQLNASSLNSNPLEEGILDAEIDRDGTLSDMFQAKDQKKEAYDNEKEDAPRFEFLIALPIENFTGQTTVKDEGIETQTRKPFVPPKSAWPVPQAQFLTAEPKLNHTTNLPDAEGDKKKVDLSVEDYVELVEIAKDSTMDGNKSVVTFVPHLNGTGFFLENDAPDTSESFVYINEYACMKRN
ncbi:uncharacterized protein LOC143920162 [Arctopsyche grandis]|uniref:uncharacterized protein LOC143920162 n=1 Tax=Arctopsyche grandis TaxID=121162 RepID=UPI00406D932D